jgi:hypothetical protein
MLHPLWVPSEHWKSQILKKENGSPSISPNFRSRSSTSVLMKIETLLYRESYCYLGLTRIHLPFD